jgi:hypothetical protein
VNFMFSFLQKLKVGICRMDLQWSTVPLHVERDKRVR